MTKSMFAVFFCMSMVAAPGCGSEGGGSGTDIPGSPDAAGGTCPTREAAPGWTYPAGPYGSDVGDTFQDFTLHDCEGNAVSFGDVLSRSELVLFNVAAGWCMACIGEAEDMEQDIHRTFCDRGLSIVQVLIEDEGSNPAGPEFCRKWRDKFGLEFAVLVDPDRLVDRYLAGVSTNELPLNMLVDHRGEIELKTTGAPPADLADRIDALLPQ